MVDARESVTAKLCAFARAWHATRAQEKIFDDDLAFDMIGRAEYEAMYEMVSRGFTGQPAPYSREDICGIGMGINMLALAITKFLLKAIFDLNGAFAGTPDRPIVPIPKVHFGFMDNIPFLNTLFNNWSLTEWFVIILIIVLQFFIFKTVWGLRLRAVGQFPEAAKTAGINVASVRYRAMAISGLIGGLAGAHLALGYSSQFVENMSSSRGFMGVAAMYFGGANPALAAVGCLLFGFADSIGARLQAYGLPSQFVLMMPYIVTIVVLAISMAAQQRTERKRQSSLT